jgi:dihydroorotase
MDFLKVDQIELPAAFDAHVHLRDGEMAKLVTPTVRQGGVNQVYVMVSRFVSITTPGSYYHCRVLFKCIVAPRYVDEISISVFVVLIVHTA